MVPVQDLERERHERPALVADGRAGAAGADVVVVRHVDVEDELLLLRHNSIEKLFWLELYSGKRLQ